MSFFGTDIHTSTIMGLFTWSYIAASNISRSRRKKARVKACSASYSITKGMLVYALSQNPVAAPPRFR